jgi:hypothetical protein
MRRPNRDNRVRRPDMESRLKGLCQGKGDLKVFGFKSLSDEWMPSMDVYVGGRKMSIVTDLSRGYDMLKRKLGGKHRTDVGMIHEVDADDERDNKVSGDYIDDMCTDATDCLGAINSLQTKPYQTPHSTSTSKVYNLDGSLCSVRKV